MVVIEILLAATVGPDTAPAAVVLHIAAAYEDTVDSQEDTADTAEVGSLVQQERPAQEIVLDWGSRTEVAASASDCVQAVGSRSASLEMLALGCHSEPAGCSGELAID